MDAAGRVETGLHAKLAGEEPSGGEEQAVRSPVEGAAGMSEGQLREIASQRWDYAFEVQTADGADRAVALLLGVLDWPTLTMTFSVAQFAAFRKGLEKHGVELAGVTRTRHPEATT
jgi:hypothetical protein